MESIHEVQCEGDYGTRRKMELKINSPTSSIMKNFSPVASPLSSPLSSPTKSGRAKKTISFLLPDTQHQTGSAEAETIEKDTEAKLEGNEGKPEIQPVVQVREEVEKEEQDGEISVKKEQRHVYEYPDFNISASSSRYLFLSFHQIH